MPIFNENLQLSYGNNISGNVCMVVRKKASSGLSTPEDRAFLKAYCSPLFDGDDFPHLNGGPSKVIEERSELEKLREEAEMPPKRDEKFDFPFLDDFLKDTRKVSSESDRLFGLFRRAEESVRKPKEVEEDSYSDGYYG
jgi:hypothetical protein